MIRMIVAALVVLAASPALADDDGGAEYREASALGELQAHVDRCEIELSEGKVQIFMRERFDDLPLAMNRIGTSRYVASIKEYGDMEYAVICAGLREYVAQNDLAP